MRKIAILHKTLNKKTLIFISLLVVYLLFWLLVARSSIQRVGAFGFVDEYTNFVVGRFMLDGRELYSEIFFHHQFLVPQISYLLQSFLHPESFYVLLLQHRWFIIIFSFVWSLLLIYRFRWIGLLFTILYESLKFNLLGSLFLGESLIVYPLTYMMALIILADKKKFLFRKFDYILGALITWFVIFSREPYAPVASLLFITLLLLGKKQKVKLISITIFTALSGLTLLSVPWKDYFYQLVTLNSQVAAKAEIDQTSILGSGLLKVFFYPFYTFSLAKLISLESFLLFYPPSSLHSPYIYLKIKNSKKRYSFF